MGFVAIDVETANWDAGSICQVGIAHFDADGLLRTWSTLVDPEVAFDEANTAIHGIDEKKVDGAPIFPVIFDQIAWAVRGAITVSHTPFDRLAFSRACMRYSLPELRTRWLDSAMVVRRAWPEWSRSGYGLANVARDLGIQFAHHDAAEDARASGEIVLAAVRVTGIDIEGWLQRVRLPINPDDSGGIRRAGNPDGPLFGEVAVFTGALVIPRREAADLAAKVGLSVTQSVTKKTTLLIVGDQNPD